MKGKIVVQLVKVTAYEGQAHRHERHFEGSANRVSVDD